MLKLYFYLHESSVNRVFPVLSLIVISIISLSVIAIFIHICIKRTRDIGWTKWSNLWLIVPYANIVFLLFLIFTPEGFSFGDFFREFGSSFIKIGMFVVVPLAVHLSKNADTVVKVGNDIPIAPVRPRAEVMDGSIAKVTEEFIKPVSDGYEILNVDASKMADQVYRDELIEQQGVLLIKSGDRSDALEYLNFSFQKPEILIAIPKTNYSVRNMYGKSLPSDLVNHITNQMRKLIPLSEQIETGLQSRWSEVKVNRIDEAIKSSNNDVIIIVGHMKDRKLLLPTGERLSISDLHQRAENNNKKILVIACNTFDGVEPDFSGLVSFDRLDYKPVMEAIKRAESVRCDAGCGTITTGSYIYSISESLALDVRLDKENRTKIKILLTISSGGVGVGVIISTEGINR